MPEFNAQGEVTKMDIGSPRCLGETLKSLLDRGLDLATVLPAFTTNVARLLRLRDKGSIGVGYAADFIVLDEAHENNKICGVSDHRSSQPTLDEILRIASDAHVAGLLTGKAGILHLHLGDGERGLQMVRDALDQSELPARVFNPPRPDMP